MRYLSIDLEATGLEENAYIIEFGAVPFDAKTKQIAHNLKLWTYVQCPTFDEMKDNLSSWVIDHNKELIEKANKEGKNRIAFKQFFEDYLQSKEIKKYFEGQDVVLFGKSMNAIDIPFMKRDLGWDWLNDHFSHRILDLTSYVYGLIDMGKLPPECESGSALMRYLNKGEVAHTALEDAIATAEIYLELLKKFS